MTEKLIGRTRTGVQLFTLPQLEVDGLDWTDAVGIIPSFLSSVNEDAIIDQLRSNYGYWRTMNGWSLDKDTKALTYKSKGHKEQDPPILPWVKMSFIAVTRPDGVVVDHKEIVYVYRYGWVCVIKPDGSFEVSRMD